MTNDELKAKMDGWEKLARAFIARTSISENGEGRGMAETILDLIAALRAKDAECEALKKAGLHYALTQLKSLDAIESGRAFTPEELTEIDNACSRFLPLLKVADEDALLSGAESQGEDK
jgi:hypothetical protein